MLHPMQWGAAFFLSLCVRWMKNVGHNLVQLYVVERKNYYFCKSKPVKEFVGLPK